MSGEAGLAAGGSSATAEFRRGWKVLVASCMGLGVGLSGLPFFSFGVFIVPLMAQFGWTRGQTAAATSALIVGTAITEPIVGMIIDRIGVRRVALVSMLGVVGAYAALTQINGNITQFYAMWLVLALIGGGTTPVVWTRGISMWFDQARGRALGLMLAGSGLSGVFGPVFCDWVISHYGWQGGYIAIGGVVLLLGWPTVYFLFQERPGDHHRTRAAVYTTGVGVGEAVRTVAFWKIAIGFFLVAAPLAATIVNLVPLLIDRGIAASDAAQVAGLMSISVVTGRVGVGFLLDRFRAQAVSRGLLAITALGCLSLIPAGGSLMMASLSVILIGLGVGAEVDLVAYLTSRYFGMKAYGKIYGWQSCAFYVAAAIGPLAAGIAFDHFQSYVPLLYVAGGGIAAGAIIVGTLGRAPDFAEA